MKNLLFGDGDGQEISAGAPRGLAMIINVPSCISKAALGLTVNLLQGTQEAGLTRETKLQALD